MAIYLIKFPRRSALEAIQLTLIREDSTVGVSFLAPFFRITGSTVWTVPGEAYVARLTESGWEAHGSTWTEMTFEGPCRLVMGVPCEPTSVSEILAAVSISNGVLSTNGVALASYHPETEMWRAVSSEKWWHAFRIETIHEHAQISDADDAAYSATGLASSPDSYDPDSPAAGTGQHIDH